MYLNKKTIGKEKISNQNNTFKNCWKPNLDRWMISLLHAFDIITKKNKKKKRRLIDFDGNRACSQATATNKFSPFDPLIECINKTNANADNVEFHNIFKYVIRANQQEKYVIGHVEHTCPKVDTIKINENDTVKRIHQKRINQKHLRKDKVTIYQVWLQKSNSKWKKNP